MTAIIIALCCVSVILCCVALGRMDRKERARHPLKDQRLSKRPTRIQKMQSKGHFHR